MLPMLNADVGEATGNDEQLMPWLQCANIACGGHAGDEEEMRKTVQLCIQHNVLIGAHPSYPDKANFGRLVMPASAAQIIDWVAGQTFLLEKICKEEGGVLHHIKPHGALYNEAAKNDAVAAAIAAALLQINPGLLLFGLSDSRGLSIAREKNIGVWHEVFADRRYNDDGSLVNRMETDALITNPTDAVKQVADIYTSGRVLSKNGNRKILQAQTVCVHSDGNNAVAIVKALHHYLYEQAKIIAT